MGDAFDQLRRGITWFQRDVHDPATQRLELAWTNPALALDACAALDKHVRHELQQKIARRNCLEWNHKVYRCERRDDFHALGGRRHRARRFRGVSQQLAHARIAPHGNRQRIAERPRLFEKTNVPGMQQVKRAARAHHSTPVAFPFAPAENQLTLRDDLSQSTVPRPFPQPFRQEESKGRFYHVRSERHEAPGKRQMK